MGATLDYSKAMAAVLERGLIKPIHRERFDHFTIEDCLGLVDRIGKARDQKFVIDSENIFAYENFIKWLHADPTMLALDPVTKEMIPGDLNKGIYIGGNTGTGKSWCCDIMRAYADLFSFKVKIGDRTRRIFWSTARAEEIVSEFVAKTNIEQYKNAPMLCVQDFGSEPAEALAMGNRQNVLRILLEHRADQTDEFTFITSNFSMCNPQLAAVYGDRVASRLYGMCNYFEIKGKDRRKM